MKEILPGFWTWSVFNQERAMNFNGHLVVNDQGCVLVDPPAMGSAELERAAGLGPPSAILITNRHHTRDAMNAAGHFKAPILLHEGDAQAIPATVRLGGTYKDGEQLPAGLTAIGLRDQKSPGECALLHARTGVLILGDALIGKPAGRLNLLPPEKYADVTKARAGLGRLLDFRFDAVLVGDGDPVLRGGRAAVEAFLSGSQTTPGLSRIGQISINVHDLDRAVAFYRVTLGMKLLFEAGGMAFFDCGGIRLMLGRAERPEFDHPGSIIYYKVEDIRAMHADLTSRGVEFLAAPHLVAKMPDHDLWMGFFKDPEGNTLALMSEMPSELRA